MKTREVSIEDVVELVETGSVQPKEAEHKFWIYKNFDHREDNLISISVAIEDEKLVLITVLLNWKVQA